MTLPLTVNETLKRLSALLILMQNRSGGDSVVLDIVSLFQHLLGSWSSNTSWDLGLPTPLGILVPAGRLRIRRPLDAKQVLKFNHEPAND